MNVLVILSAPLTWYRDRLEARRVRADLLAAPGVTAIVVEVMDVRYGIGHWRVSKGMLEAQVMTPGTGTTWWGPIGMMGHVSTRNWIARVYAEQRGVNPPTDEPPEFVGPYDAMPDLCPKCGRMGGTHEPNCITLTYFRGAYADTEPFEVKP